MALWQEWSMGWIKEGHYISYPKDNIKNYEYVISRDILHYVYHWPEIINAGATSGPFVPDELEITKGYNAKANQNHLWQVIFGIMGQVYIYIELPTDTHRHGIPKIPKPNTIHRDVSHFEEWMSPFMEPSFVTEHFMMRPETLQIGLDAFNPNAIAMTPQLNFFISSMVTERVGTEEYGELSTPFIENDKSKTDRLAYKWKDTLEKLYKQQIPCRPITLMPVRMPAEAPSGE